MPKDEEGEYQAKKLRRGLVSRGITFSQGQEAEREAERVRLENDGLLCAIITGQPGGVGAKPGCKVQRPDCTIATG